MTTPLPRVLQFITTSQIDSAKLVEHTAGTRDVRKQRPHAPSLSVHSSPPASGLGSAGRWRLCGGSPATVDMTTRWHRPPRSREYAVLEKNQTPSLIFVKAFFPFLLILIYRDIKSIVCAKKSLISSLWVQYLLLNCCSMPIIKINQEDS